MSFDPEAFDANARALTRLNRAVSRSFGGLHQAALDDGALDRMTKELIALSISVVQGCEDCCGHHLEQAREAGAPTGQIAEALGVAVMMGGGPAFTYAGKLAASLGDD